MLEISAFFCRGLKDLGRGLMTQLGTNLRRVMARFDLTIDQVVESTGLDARTIKGILRNSNRPHARTLHRLANGLGVSTDEFFQTPSLLAHRVFDRQSNPVIDQIVSENRQVFDGWSESNFDELCSRFGAGGALTPQGALQTAERMNQNRDVHRKVAVLLESGEADLLKEFVALLYRRGVIPSDGDSCPPLGSANPSNAEIR